MCRVSCLDQASEPGTSRDGEAGKLAPGQVHAKLPPRQAAAVLRKGVDDQGGAAVVEQHLRGPGDDWREDREEYKDIKPTLEEHSVWARRFGPPLEEEGDGGRVPLVFTSYL